MDGFDRIVTHRRMNLASSQKFSKDLRSFSGSPCTCHSSVELSASESGCFIRGSQVSHCSKLVCGRPKTHHDRNDVEQSSFAAGVGDQTPVRAHKGRQAHAFLVSVEDGECARVVEETVARDLQHQDRGERTFSIADIKYGVGRLTRAR